MPTRIETPDFKSEQEEAEWWDSHPEVLLDAFKKAAAEGTLKRLPPTRSATPTTTIRLDPTDIELAKEQAAQRGLKYQTYLKMLIHRALRSETQAEKKSA